ncbi:hypothetical protein W822_20265 [Advenella kashmirensis W13003]|uniref:Uncharacterized protein n=1 Tax=Advenella kashmirensis W13003 TaxID=1424334 RepID=V8QNP7_9BURK|nr:hypothetical protein W822_20265 [Advenella kashmirensis W13003]
MDQFPTEAAADDSAHDITFVIACTEARYKYPMDIQAFV